LINKSATAVEKILHSMLTTYSRIPPIHL